jgi:hypothetical protein
MADTLNQWRSPCSDTLRHGSSERVCEDLAMSAADRLAGDPYTAPSVAAAALITIDTQRDFARGLVPTPRP